MKILSIESSCDESAVSIIDFKENKSFEILANELFSQVNLHKKYGGVFPTLAKREHQKNLPLLTKTALEKANINKKGNIYIDEDKKKKLKIILEKDKELYEKFVALFSEYKKNDLDYIAVTVGPGLSPALWVGVNFAKALSFLFEVPLIPVNHMEGHFVSALVKNNTFIDIKYPAIALLVSGGHTELIFQEREGEYKKIGQTLDDASGEAFDKIARLLNLDYPGGPEISRLSKKAREKKLKLDSSLPRPIIKTDDFNFSYSGLKTAAKKLIENTKDIKEEDKEKIAREVEDAIVETLLTKTKKAMETLQAKTLIVAGGVSCNEYLREVFINEFKKYQELTILFPEKSLSTDNSIMIGFVGFLKSKNIKNIEDIKADPNLSL